MSSEQGTGGSPIQLRQTEPDRRVRRLLESNELPTADIETSAIHFFEAVVEGETIGVGGFELYGSAALLRSVAVESSMRDQGYGTQLCRELETRIGERGCDTIYLLTDDARGFFERFGFEQCDRTAAPEDVRESREFRDLCSSTAVCMVKELNPE